MKTLVVYDTKHGASADAAAAIARGLGPEAVTARAGAASESLEAYDLVVIGGPVYFGKLPESLGRFAAAHAEELAGKRLALFALGSMPNDYEGLLRAALPAELLPRVERIARFGGRIDPASLGLAERFITKLVAKVAAKEGREEIGLDLAEAERFGRELRELRS